MLPKTTMSGEMDIARREAVIVSVTEALMEGDRPVLIVEKGVVLITAMGLVHIRGRGAALIMGMATAVVEAPIEESEVALFTGVEALVPTEERGMILCLFMSTAAVLITKSGGEPTGLPPIVSKKERLKKVMDLTLVQKKGRG